MTGWASSRAEQTLDKPDRTADPAYLGYFDEAYLAAKFGHAFKALDDHGQAERFACRSLIMDSNYVRGRAFNLALLATALVGKGDIEEAIDVATEARSLSRTLRSARAEGYVRELSAKLTPHERAVPAVRDFLGPESSA